MYKPDQQQVFIQNGNGQHSYPPAAAAPQNGFGGPPNNTAVVTEQARSLQTNVVVNTGSRAPSERSWSTQLCGCMEDVPDCLCGLFCFPLHMCMLASRMKELFCLPFCVPCSLMAMRTKIRAQNRIKGTICKDFLVTSCCAQLAACQLKREMDNIERKKPGTEL